MFGSNSLDGRLFHLAALIHLRIDWWNWIESERPEWAIDGAVLISPRPPRRIATRSEISRWENSLKIENFTQWRYSKPETVGYIATFPSPVIHEAPRILRFRGSECSSVLFVHLCLRTGRAGLCGPARHSYASLMNHRAITINTSISLNDGRADMPHPYYSIQWTDVCRQPGSLMGLLE